MKPVSAIKRFLAWWRRELAMLLPERVRRWYARADTVVMFNFHAAHNLDALCVRHGWEADLGEANLEPLTPTGRKHAVRRLLRRAGGYPYRYLRLPPDRVLKKEIVLPIAVQENLRQSISFELDRHTPFKPDQVYADYLVVHRDTQQLRIELAVVPRDVLNPMMQWATAAGVPLDGAALHADVLRDGAAGLNLLPEARRAKRLPWRAVLRGLATLIVLGLVAVFLAIPVWQKHVVSARLHAQVDEARLAMQRVDAMRLQMEKLATEHNLPHAQRAALPSRLVTLDELSRILPDDTFLNQLDINGQDVQLQGEAASASRLIETLEQSGLFKNASLKSPVTKVAGTASERFQIGAELEEQVKPDGASSTPLAKNP